MNRIFVVRVGADTNYARLRSPVFGDGRFEFVPTPEIQEGEKKGPPILFKPPMKCYRDIESFYGSGETLDKYVPGYAECVAHNDPEFKYMTYGDLCEANSRARNLIGNEKKQGVEPTDYLFFLARLEPHDGKQFIPDPEIDSYYFIGYFCIEKIWKPWVSLEETAIGYNAHVLRAKADPSVLGNDKYKFWVFKGSVDSSIRFPLALEAKYDWLSQIFTTADKRHWCIRPGRKKLETISSYTRTVRCQIDPNDPQQRDSYYRFWEKIHKHLALCKSIM